MKIERLIIMSMVLLALGHSGMLESMREGAEGCPPYRNIYLGNINNNSRSNAYLELRYEPYKKPIDIPAAGAFPFHENISPDKGRIYIRLDDQLGWELWMDEHDRIILSAELNRKAIASTVAQARQINININDKGEMSLMREN